MKLSKQRKAYVAILALALLALTVDRLFLAGGDSTAGASSAEASPAPSRSTGPPTGPDDTSAPAAAPAAIAAMPGPRLAERLRRLASTQALDMKRVTDAFACDAAWIPRAASPEPTTRPSRPVRTFQDRHALMAVMGGPRGSAIVDGRCLLVGQELEGHRLISVGERSVVFQGPGGPVVLRLKD